MMFPLGVLFSFVSDFINYSGCPQTLDAHRLLGKEIQILYLIQGSKSTRQLHFFIPSVLGLNLLSTWQLLQVYKKDP